MTIMLISLFSFSEPLEEYILFWLRRASVTYAAHFSAVRVVTGQWILGIRLIREDRAQADGRSGEEGREERVPRQPEEPRVGGGIGILG